MGDSDFVQMPDDNATPTAPASVRARADSDRGARISARTGSGRALVDLASWQDETPATASSSTTTTRAGRTGSSVGSQTSLPFYTRAISSLLRLDTTAEAPTSEETFRCHICFDDVGVSETVALASCGHKYCLSCVKPYVKLKITEGNVYPVCFHPIEHADGDADTTCGVTVNQDQIKQIVDPEVYTKYEYFRFNKEHQHARECPYCAHSQDCVGPENPVCVCTKCEKPFCFFHGNAHENGTCADYELKNAQEEALNRAKINEIAKTCPGCHRDVEKNGGCNHMKCIACNTNFCWLCGEIVEDTPMPSHYSAVGGGACSGMQFDGMEQVQQMTQRHTYTPRQWFFLVLFTLLAVPPTFVVACVLAPLTWVCSRGGKSLSEVFEEIQTWTLTVLCAFLGFVLTPAAWVFEICFAVVAFIVILCSLVIKDFCCCCCTSSGQPENNLNAPDAPVANDLEAGLV